MPVLGMRTACLARGQIREGDKPILTLGSRCNGAFTVALSGCSCTSDASARDEETFCVCAQRMFEEPEPTTLCSSASGLALPSSLRPHPPNNPQPCLSQLLHKLVPYSVAPSSHPSSNLSSFPLAAPASGLDPPSLLLSTLPRNLHPHLLQLLPKAWPLDPLPPGTASLTFCSSCLRLGPSMPSSSSASATVTMATKQRMAPRQPKPPNNLQPHLLQLLP